MTESEVSRSRGWAISLVGQRNFCIWLGEASSDSDQTMEFVEQVSQLGNPDQLVKDTGSVEKWKPLSSLMGRPWFPRRWVVQEVASSREATLYCGTKEARWSDFSDAVMLFGNRFAEIEHIFSRNGSRLAETRSQE
ncbi:uncharacterized protein K444DRAFT_438887 [Hyaloscypha bicolor E]|uniref:Heterokaryon incompatibility domain-containing protein n=1 Tax=Hyaloscypha bicolor E TaxID=1095630 RepID=A0A2J6T587_9HELO|nr:uncharacterized protein K444DRAFT_438887 [Hyaloscypha bicolor E]PMD58175.1 hypothetical protein K444DRAFT_438887 [Hyaloscypha bicolor E]